jgi:hypothetical protein
MPGLGFPDRRQDPHHVGDGEAFPTAGCLAAYAGLAPVPRRSGTSIKERLRARRAHRSGPGAGRDDHALQPHERGTMLLVDLPAADR